MKISTNWLQKYFEKPLPSAEIVADAFTFHSFEIDSIEGNVLDVKVLPNRAADCLSHRGIAKDLSAILDMPMKFDPFRGSLESFPTTDMLTVEVDSAYVLRHTGALVKGVKVGPSPAWLKEALESLGQRSINNIVDATNYIMLDLGQPMHAFDARKIVWDKETLRIAIRSAHTGEKITILTGEEYILTDDMYVIADATSGVALDIAGIKGGMASGIDEGTSDLFVSVGNYDGTLIRKVSQKLKIFTDASQRYQNRPSPELTAYGMHAILNLIKEVAGGELVGVVDVYPNKPASSLPVSVSLVRINEVLGSDFTEVEVMEVFRRLDLPLIFVNGVCTVTPSFERTDILIAEDLIEEVGRILGYDRVKPAELSGELDVDQAQFRGTEHVKDFLVERGFTEISTQSFASKGEVILANPLDKTKPALRTTLAENLKESLAKAKLHAPTTLEPNIKPKLFEVGTVFSKDGERISVETSEVVPDMPALVPDSSYVPKRYTLGLYKPFSLYPFIVRDIAFWVPDGTDVGPTRSHIVESAGPLVVRCELFDTFSKDGRTSYAFRLVFQADDRTLTDEEINTWMDLVTKAVTQKNWEVR
ncbi:MAG: phenylalanine--tRNA ligase subunit beta [Candidatus Paceibacterota bacterium]